MVAVVAGAAWAIVGLIVVVAVVSARSAAHGGSRAGNLSFGVGSENHSHCNC